MDGRLDAAAVGEPDGARAGLRQAQGGDLSGGQAQGLAEAGGEEDGDLPLLPVRALHDDGDDGAQVRADSADDHGYFPWGLAVVSQSPFVPISSASQVQQDRQDHGAAGGLLVEELAHGVAQVLLDDQPVIVLFRQVLDLVHDDLLDLFD